MVNNRRNLMSKEVDQILQKCYNDSEFMAKMFFPRHFSRPFDKVHDQIFDLLDNSDNPKKLILAPRGIGKTTIDNLLIPAKKMLFHEKRYIVPVGSTAETAVEQSENLKNELLDNDTVQSLFDLEKTGTFAKNNWIMKVGGHEVNIRPKGAGQKLRGMLWNGYRPDLIIVDDLEDDESVRNETRRKDLSDWFHGALLNTVDRGKDNWEIIVIGTLLHEDSLLMNLHENPDWDSVVIELCDDEYNSYAPNFMSTKEVKELAEQYKNAGKLDVFYREYRNIPISLEDADFRQEYFKYYEENERDENGKLKHDFAHNSNIATFVIADIARSTKISSADSAIVGVSINMETNQIFVRDVVHGKMHPDEIYDQAINMCKRLKARYLGVEVTGLNEFITYPLRNELSRKAPGIELIELQARGGVQESGKTERVRSLVPFYRQGLVFHNKTACDALEAQLLSFPRSKRWDIMDALGYSVEMLEKGQKYMFPQMDGYDSPEVIEAEFAELEKEMDFGPQEDFRII